MTTEKYHNSKAILCFIIILNLLTALNARELALPSSSFYYQPAASVFGSEAVWINPSSLSKYRLSGFQMFSDLENDRFLKNYGVVIVREGLGLAYRTVYNPDGDNYKEFIYAAGSSINENLNLGLSFKKVSNLYDPGSNKYFSHSIWNVSLSGKYDNHFKWAAVFSNFNHTKINDEKTNTNMRYSIAYRPMNNSKLTLSADMILSTSTKMKNAAFIYHAESEIIPGLYVNGYIDDNKSFEIGARVNLLNYFIGSKRIADKNNNHRRTTFFFGAVDHKQNSIIKNPKRVLRMDISGTPQENPVKPVFGKKSISFMTTILQIYRAADDASVPKILINLNRPRLGLAQAEELKNALDYYRSKKKEIICYINYPDNISYYIASSADKILISPVSQLNLTGLRAELTFMGKTLDKIGVKIELLRIGEYKSAAETFTNQASTPENKEQVNRILDNLYENFCEGIARGREMPIDSVKKIIDNGPFTSKEAMQFGLVDGLCYLDEIDELNDQYIKITAPLENYIGDTLISDDWNNKPVIAIVTAGGEVTQTGSSFPWFGSNSEVNPSLMKRAFTKAASDNDVKGIIFRINSPGGDALAGDEIYHESYKASQKKLLVTSMSNLSASGGYYIATPSQYLFANPSTITGSIGIYGGKADFSGLYEKLELGKELYIRGDNAGMLSSIKPFTQSEKEKYFSHLKAMYDHFVELVAQSRNLNPDSVDNLGRGRIWTGNEALANGLIDKIGGIKQTLDFTAQRLNLTDYTIRIYPEKRTLFNIPGKNLLSSVFSWLKASGDSDDSKTELLLDGSVGIFTRLPYDIEIK